MARRIKDATLDSRAERRKLKPRGEPYYRAVERGAHLGYRRRPEAAGTWLLRHFTGKAYRADRIGIADDLSDADGERVLDYWQAVDAVRKRMAEHGRAIAEAPRTYTVGDAMDAYIKQLESEGRSAHALRDLRSRDRVHIRPKLGKLKVADLMADKLRDWHGDLAKAPAMLRSGKGKQRNIRHATSEDAQRARRASANRTRTVLVAALNHAFNDKKVPSDAEWKRAKRFKEVDAARVRYLSVAESKRLLNTCDPGFRILVHAALVTGCRYGELCRLTVEDFNPDVGTLQIQKSKSGKPRHVVLTDEGRAFFEQLTAGRAGAETMLRGPDGGSWQMSHQLRPMAEAVKRAKIAPAISFHGLRHTWASHSVMNGVPLLVVAKNLGHTDTRMVERHYGHLAPSFIVDAIRKGAPRFGFKPDGKVAALTPRR